MNNENLSIHEYQYELICEYFSQLQRQGPGSKEVTQLALNFIDNLPGKDAKIADLGCGTGGQTITLAENTEGHISALELFPKFLEILRENAATKGLSDRITTINESMENLPFEENSLDLIWSEGAIYNVGFEKGMQDWNRYLKKEGFIAVTEASWFTDSRPEEIENFWMINYPEMNTIPVKIAQMQQAGYKLTAHFILPEYCWTENFFAPQKAVQEAFLTKYKNNEIAENFIYYMQQEKELYSKYKAYYGYVFYIGQKL